MRQEGSCSYKLNARMTPISYFTDIWNRCAELQALHAYLAANVTSAISADELLRAEWVLRVSALDLYVHELVAQNMVEIFAGRRPMCSGFSRFKCSNETLMRVKGAKTDAEATSAFDLEVRSKLSRISYQYPDDIADGIRFITAIELWNNVALARGATNPTKAETAKSIRRDLSLIVGRRNKIAHEGDLQPSVPRTPWPISRSDVSYAAKSIEELVKNIDSIV